MLFHKNIVLSLTYCVQITLKSNFIDMHTKKWLINNNDLAPVPEEYRYQKRFLHFSPTPHNGQNNPNETYLHICLYYPSLGSLILTEITRFRSIKMTSSDYVVKNSVKLTFVLEGIDENVKLGAKFHRSSIKLQYGHYDLDVYPNDSKGKVSWKISKIKKYGELVPSTVLCLVYLSDFKTCYLHFDQFLPRVPSLAVCGSRINVRATVRH